MPIIIFNRKWTAAAHFANCTYYLCFLHCRIGCEIWRKGLSKIPLSNRRWQRELPSVFPTQDICCRGHGDVHQCLWLGDVRGTTFFKHIELTLLTLSVWCACINLKYKENPAIQIIIEWSQETSLHPMTNTKSKCLQQKLVCSQERLTAH